MERLTSQQLHGGVMVGPRRSASRQKLGPVVGGVKRSVEASGEVVAVRAAAARKVRRPFTVGDAPLVGRTTKDKHRPRG